MDKLTTKDILEAHLDDWRKLAQALHARYLSGDFATGVGFVDAIAEAAEEANHHPDITLGYTAVDVRLISHDAGGLTERDVSLARRISEIAAERGLTAAPGAVSQFELGLDTPNAEAIGPFWAALLTGDQAAFDGEVRDPQGLLPNLWFQRTEPHQTPRQRFHVDIWVGHDQLDARVAAALAAGGTIVDDRRAPMFVVLADPDGNRACVCTALDR